MNYATGTLSDLTAKLNEAITELSAPITLADGTLASATSQLNLLIDWTAKPVAHADGTLTSGTSQYNALAAYYIYAIRFYLLPIDRQLDTEGRTVRGPLYFKWRYNPSGINCRWSMKDYGSIDMGVIAADISDADHNALILNTDVYSYPLNLDVLMVLSDRQALNTYLESHGIPGDWLKQGDTFRYALKTVTAMFLYLQRTLAILNYPVDPFAGLSLNTRYNQLTTAYQNAMSQAATDLGYVWDVVGNDQIRKIWKMMSEQWGNRDIYFGGFVTL